MLTSRPVTPGDSIRSWAGFPFDPQVGEGPKLKDTPPERTLEGDFILYHGTSLPSARAILRLRTLLPDNLGYVGVGTTPGSVATYAAMKHSFGGSAILRLVLDVAWVTSQEIVHETGGSGRDQFLLSPNPRCHREAGATFIHSISVPPTALKEVRIIRRF
jgi:hypothetical protein